MAGALNGLIRPIASPSANHMPPSAPATIAPGSAESPPRSSVILPLGVIQPTPAGMTMLGRLRADTLVNQTLPSGPAARYSGPAPGMPPCRHLLNSAVCPLGVIRPKPGWI